MQIDWLPVEQAPDRYMRALVQLRDGSITIGLRQEYYTWHWIIAVVAHGHGNQGNVWSHASGDNIVAFCPLET